MSTDSTRISELIFRGDNRSAVRALEGIAKQSTDTKDSLKANSDEESLSMDRVREHTTMLRDTMTSLAGMAGIGAVSFGLKDLVEDGMNLQGAQGQLQAALRATGQQAGGAASQLEKMAVAMSTKGGFTATQNLSALTQFVRETKSATEAQKLLALSTNIARGTNSGLAETQQMVAKAYTGQARGLQSLLGPMVAHREAQVGLSAAHAQQIAQLQNEYGLMGKLGQMKLRDIEATDHITAQQAALAQLTDKRATATQLLGEASKYFAHSTSVYDAETQGHMSDLRDSVQNLTESLGQALLPAMDDIVHVAAGVAEWMSKNKTVVLDTSIAVAGLSAAWGGLKILRGIKTMVLDLAKAFGIVTETEVVAATEGTAAVTELTIAWDRFMAATVAGLVILGLVELVEHWKAVEHAAVDAWHWIEGAAKDAWHWIEHNWPLLAGIVFGPIGFAVGEIITHFNQVKHIVSDVVNFIERIFKDVFNAITFPFRKAFDFIKSGFHDVEHVVGDVTGFLSHPFGLHFSHGGVVPKYLAAGGAIDGGPSGTDTVPAWLSPNEGVVNTQGMARIGGQAGLNAINSGAGLGGLGGQRLTISGSPVSMRLDSRIVGEAVVQWALNRAARGTSSLVGGSLVTGTPGLAAASTMSVVSS